MNISYSLKDSERRSAASLRGWETRRKRLERPAYTKRTPRPTLTGIVWELEKRIELLDVSRSEHYCLLRALEERIATAPRKQVTDAR